jgi:hypothetical protein
MKFKQKGINQTRERKVKRLEYRIVIGFMIAYVSYFMFFEPFFVGNDKRYFFYICLLPTLIGLILLAYYRRQSILNNIKNSESYKIKIFVIVFYLFQGVLISYFSFGLVSKIIWDLVNYQTAKQNFVVVYDCKVTRFVRSRHSNKIHFMFKGKDESVSVDYATIKEYIDKNPNRYKIKITTREGAWNYYYVEDWDISN